MTEQERSVGQLAVADRVGEVHTTGEKIRFMLEAVGAFRNCGNCDSWYHPHGCKIFQAMPPQHIIASGCDKHSDLIPF